MSSITERENILLSLLGYEMFQRKLQIDAVLWTGCQYLTRERATL